MTDPRDLISAATPLPWVMPKPPDGVGEGMIYGGDGWAVVDSMVLATPERRKRTDWKQPFTRPDGQHIRDADLIVYAVNNLPAYLDVAEALRRLLDAIGEGGGVQRDAEAMAYAALARLEEHR